jgi:anhydro-N-acetylmuramic acid kinase
MPAAANANDTRLIAGAMSGTSADGVDVAIVRIDGHGLAMSAKLICHHHRPYEPALKQAIFALRESGQVALADLARIGREISLTYAAAINEAFEIANLKSEMVEAVAAHGQTLYHAPPDTIQWLDPALIAAETGCAVVSDFRRADCAAGGQGAPLVPFADYIIFGHRALNRVLLNIGGIANLTFVPASATPQDVIAFDAGPGNCICDWLCREADPLGPGYDTDGRIAENGSALLNTVDEVMKHPYFKLKPPKSTDVPTMVAAWRDGLARDGRAPPDVASKLMTAAILTSTAIWEAISQFLPRMPHEIIVSGGGARNPHIMSGLETWLSIKNLPTKLMTLEDMGLQVESKEAIAFALLAAATLDGLPSNVPSCTGAKRQVILGSITPKPA